MVREPNACMCGRGCEPVLHYLQTVRIPFAAESWNLLAFCANIKIIWCAGCPLRASGVFCSPQVRGKLINRASSANCSWTIWFACGLLVCTILYLSCYFNSPHLFFNYSNYYTFEKSKTPNNIVTIIQQN